MQLNLSVALTLLRLERAHSKGAVLETLDVPSVLRQLPVNLLFKKCGEDRIYSSDGFQQFFGANASSRLDDSSIAFYDPISKAPLEADANPFVLGETGGALCLWVRLKTNLFTFNCLVESKVVNLEDGNWIVLYVRNNADELSGGSNLSSVGKHLSFHQLLTNCSSKLINASECEVKTIIDQTLAAFGEFGNIDRCYMFEFSNDRTFMTNTHEWVAAGVTPYISELQNMPTSDMPYFMDHIQEGMFKVDDVSKIPDCAAAEREEFMREHICSILCVRIMVGGTLYGFVGCDIIGSPYKWQSYDVEYLERIGEILGNTLQNLVNRKAIANMQDALLDANKRLEHLANIDGLTEIPNRRVFDTTLSKQIELSRAKSTPLALLLVDADAFKLYNDNYGHVAGDDALKQIAKSLSNSCIGKDDLAARYGGEEFAVILPGVSKDEVHKIATRILRNIRRLGIFHEYSAHQSVLTVSIGMACLLDGKDSPTQLVQRADEALYRAKSAGKNCAHF